MTAEVENILRSFESLPEEDRRELASEIIRRSLKLPAARLSEEELVLIAEDFFLELEPSEGDDAWSGSGRVLVGRPWAGGSVTGVGPVLPPDGGARYRAFLGPVKCPYSAEPRHNLLREVKVLTGKKPRGRVTLRKGGTRCRFGR